MAKDHSQGLIGPLARGAYVARLATDRAQVEAAQRLRHRCFVEAAGRSPLAGDLDADRFDALCDHVVIEDSDGALVATFRVHCLAPADAVRASYSASFYDLTVLADQSAPIVELGRFCVSPDVQDADVLRLAWGVLARYVDGHGAGMLMGCSSFRGVDPTPYRGAFDVLAAGHASDQVGRRAPDIFEYLQETQTVVDRKAALAQVPALLRSYLGMGGWVSDHAVVDHQMQTLHVFTGLVIADIPPNRAAALRAV